MKANSRWLKVSEVAEELRINRGTAYEMVSSGQLPAVRIGKSLRVSRHELDRFVTENSYPGTR